MSRHVPQRQNVDNFRRFWWLPGAHLETIASVFNKTPLPRYSRRIVSTRDNDEIALDYIVGAADKPLIALFHGLEGCSRSRAMRLLASGFAAAGWTVAAPHFRSCGGCMNRLPRAYHAADVADVRWMLDYCRADFPREKTFAAGVSLGGAALLQCLAQTGAEGVRAAAAICAPFDLEACVRLIDGGWRRRVYARHFLSSLRAKVLAKAERYPDIVDVKKLRAAKTIGEFDELYTAPVHGFSCAVAYWRRGSVGAETLGKIACPLLCVNPLNDPLIPPQTLPVSAPPGAVFCRPPCGGHGGFFGAPKDWLFHTTRDFFAAA